MADHWHVTAETVTKTRRLSIAAVMVVYDDQQPLDVELQQQDGWLGATARGDFGHVKGWIRYDDTHTPPGDVPAGTGDTPVAIWGQSRDGEPVFRTARIARQ